MNANEQEALRQRTMREMKVFFDLYGFENGAERYRHAIGLLEAERKLGCSFDRILSDADATQEDWDDLQRTKDDAAILLTIEHEPVL